MNVKTCNADGGDCQWFLDEFPNCKVSRPEKLGDGFCDGRRFFTMECAFDGGDCTLTYLHSFFFIIYFFYFFYLLCVCVSLFLRLRL